MSNQPGRIPPHSMEAEQDLLGSCLLSEEAVSTAVSLLKPQDFYQARNRGIFAVIIRLVDDGIPVDMVSVVNRLQSEQKLEECGGPAYIADLTTEVVFTSRAETYAGIIKAHAVLRRLIIAGQSIVELCYKNLPADEIIAEAETEIFAATADGKRTAVPFSTVTSEVMETIRKRQSTTGLVTGLSTGFSEFDRMTTGLQPGELTVIAARPSMGKTALAVNIASTVAAGNTPAVIYSLEMARGLLGERILSEMSSVNSVGIRAGSLKQDELDSLLTTAASAGDMPLYIDDTPYMTITDLRIKAARAKAKYKIGMLVIDYMQLMSGLGNKKREQQVAEISRGLKGIARQLDIPVIALSQLNRGLEQRADKRPMLSDLRESGAIEQDADNIVFLFRADYYRKSNDQYRDNLATIIIAKQRNGPTGDFELNFDGSVSRFSDLKAGRYPQSDGSGQPWMHP